MVVHWMHLGTSDMCDNYNQLPGAQGSPWDSSRKGNPLVQHHPQGIDFSLHSLWAAAPRLGCCPPFPFPFPGEVHLLASETHAE